MRRHSSPHPPGRKGQQGFALLLMLVLVTMGLLFTIVSQVSLVGMKAARAQGDAAVLLQAKEALLGFAATYRDNSSSEVFGYLPCPDTVGDGVAHGPCGNAGETVVGLLPYRTLGLESLRDSTGTCLWYVVSGSHKDNPKTAPLNWDTQGNISVVDMSGNVLVAPNDAGGGAAAVIIAAGAPQTGQARSGSAYPCGAVPSEVSAYLDGTYTFPNAGTVQLTQGQPGNTTNNDQMIALTPKEIFGRIITRSDFKNPLTASPAGDINSLSDAIRMTLESQIQSDLQAGGTPTGIAMPDTSGGYAPINGKVMGDLSLSALSGTYATYYDNWRNQYRYVVCSDLSTPCLDIAGNSCRAALMFGGQAATGPRGTLTSSPATLDRLFEGNTSTPADPNGALDILNSNSTSFSATGNTSYLAPNTATSADVATCVFPGSFVSFAQNIANFSAGLTNSGGGNLAAVNTVGKSITLGGSSGSAAGSGCVWDASAIQTGKLIRLYFRINFATKGNGLALALADAATNLAPDNPARTQILCGASGDDTLGYSGIPPSGSSAGIAMPKLGIEFDTNYNSGRNDPLSDHIAFLYWGNAADNGIGGSGADDNTHYLGEGGVAVTGATWSNGVATFTTASNNSLASGQMVVISGTSPSGYSGTFSVLATGLTSTQFKVNIASNPGPFITNATWSSGRATFTTATNHGLVAGQLIGISGANPDIYNDTYTVQASGLTSTQFQVTAASNLGAFLPSSRVKPLTAAGPRNPRVATALKSIAIVNARRNPLGCTTSCTARITTASAHGLSVGDRVHISGVSVNGYNGTYIVTLTPSTTQFRYVLTSNPGANVINSGSIAIKDVQISALSWSTGTAHATTLSPAHGFGTGQALEIAGVTPSGYDVSAIVANPGSTSFDYAIAPDPGGSFTAEQPAGMFVPRSSTATPYKYLNSASIPTSSNIYVRLDISRTYDATNHVAMLNMKAYVGNTFGSIPDTCTSASDLQNLTQDLSEQCRFRTVTLQQDSIPIAALATINAATWAANTVTVTTAAAHRLVNGAKVTISGISPAAYNGTYTVSVTGTNTFTYSLTGNPGSYVSGGDIQPMTMMYLGFTNARGNTTTSENQSVAIDQLLLRSQ